MSDIHGDYRVLMDCLMMTNVIRWNSYIKDYEWIAGPEVEVVIIGDVVDGARVDKHGSSQPSIMSYAGAAEKMILYTIGYFQMKSRAAGNPNGLIYCLGNHEIINLFPFRFSNVMPTCVIPEFDPAYVKMLFQHYATYSPYVHTDELEAAFNTPVADVIKRDVDRDFSKYANLCTAMIQYTSTESRRHVEVYDEFESFFTRDERGDIRQFHREKFKDSRLFRYLLRLDSYNTVSLTMPSIWNETHFADAVRLEETLANRVTYGTLLFGFCNTKLTHTWNKVCFLHGGLDATSLDRSHQTQSSRLTTFLVKNDFSPSIHFQIDPHFTTWQTLMSSGTLTSRDTGYLLVSKTTSKPIGHRHLAHVDDVVVGHCPQTCAGYTSVLKSALRTRCEGEASFVLGELLRSDPRVIDHHLCANDDHKNIAIKQHFVRVKSDGTCADMLRAQCSVSSNQIGINGTEYKGNKRVWRVDSGASMAFTHTEAKVGEDPRTMSVHRSSVLQISCLDNTTFDCEYCAWTIDTSLPRTAVGYT
ncbi:hypothetical protein CYMTET_7302 [Cymbomonas tetramitiformis]|uniref:Calcineurin-like phosphoesterase domain-containing protein n=1 Tax=Cymbomonas tetramitiformis TaxID=36881 RepID=A0AAE0GVE2_9CHLO|nr:hypothetical protein CYMTET_7302 [Cymbomonas tetramitiformis]